MEREDGEGGWRRKVKKEEGERSMMGEREKFVKKVVKKK